MLVVVGGGGTLSLLTGVGGALSDRGREIPEGERERRTSEDILVFQVKTARTNGVPFPLHPYFGYKRHSDQGGC